MQDFQKNSLSGRDIKNSAVNSTEKVLGQDSKSEVVIPNNHKYFLRAHFYLIYIPLFIFLVLAIVALAVNSFAVVNSPASSRYLDQLDEFKRTALEYRKACLSENEPSICIQKYLDDQIFSNVTLLQNRYEDLSSSYTTIGIMTGFFGVLMTVLIIYFSISGREAIQLKLDSTEGLLDKAHEALHKADFFEKDFQTRVTKEFEGFDHKIKEEIEKLTGKINKDHSVQLKKIGSDLQRKIDELRNHIEQQNNLLTQEAKKLNAMREELDKISKQKETIKLSDISSQQSAKQRLSGGFSIFQNSLVLDYGGNGQVANKRFTVSFSFDDKNIIDTIDFDADAKSMLKLESSMAMLMKDLEKLQVNLKMVPSSDKEGSNVEDYPELITELKSRF